MISRQSGYLKSVDVKAVLSTIRIMAEVDPKVAFGIRLRQLREKRGVSQEQLAQMVGMDRSYVGSVERGERNVSLENICKLAAGLAVAPARLLESADA